MHRSRAIAAALVLAAGALAALVPVAASASAAALAAPTAAGPQVGRGFAPERVGIGDWPGPGNAQLNGVSADGARDAWAVGSTLSRNFTGKTLTVRWDGATWKRVPSPNAGAAPYTDALFAVSTRTTNDAWAVGNYFDDSLGADAMLTMHWNGTAWSIVPVSSPGDEYNELIGVDDVAANDVWAVGDYMNQGGDSIQCILHWDGSSWTQVGVPTPRKGALIGVSADSASHAWAVGYTGDGTVTLRWDGSKWRRVASPNPGRSPLLLSVQSLSSEDAWAVGFRGNFHQPLGTLALHWNGHRWSQVSSPSPGLSPVFTSVSASGPDDVWAVGFTVTKDRTIDTLTYRWDGDAWRRVASPNPADENFLDGVASIAPSDVLAVGSVFTGDFGRTLPLALQWNGSAWHRIHVG
jgi:hypothetical protein